MPDIEFWPSFLMPIDFESAGPREPTYKVHLRNGADCGATCSILSHWTLGCHMQCVVTLDTGVPHAVSCHTGHWGATCSVLSHWTLWCHMQYLATLDIVVPHAVSCHTGHCAATCGILTHWILWCHMQCLVTLNHVTRSGEYFTKGWGHPVSEHPRCQLIINNWITTKISTCNGSSAAMACANFCCDWIPQNSNTGNKTLVEFHEFVQPKS